MVNRTVSLVAYYKSPYLSWLADIHLLLLITKTYHFQMKFIKHCKTIFANIFQYVISLWLTFERKTLKYLLLHVNIQLSLEIINFIHFLAVCISTDL